MTFDPTAHKTPDYEHKLWAVMALAAAVKKMSDALRDHKSAKESDKSRAKEISWECVGWIQSANDAMPGASGPPWEDADFPDALYTLQTYMIELKLRIAELEMAELDRLLKPLLPKKPVSHGPVGAVLPGAGGVLGPQVAAIGGLLGQSPATAGRPGFGGPLGGGGAIGGKGPPSKTGPGGPLWSGSPVLGKGGGGAKGLPVGGSFPDPRQIGGVGSGSSSGGGTPGWGGTSAGLGGASTDVEHQWKDGTGGGGGSQSGGAQGAGQTSPAGPPGASAKPAVSVDAGMTEPAAPTPVPDTANAVPAGGHGRPAGEGAGGRSGSEKDNSTRFPTRGRPADDDPRGSGDAPHAPYHLGLYKGPELAPPIADANLLLPTPLWLQVQGTSGGSSAPQDDRGGNNPRFADPRLVYKPNPEDTSGGGGGDPRVFVYKPNPEEDGGGSGGGVGGPRGRVESAAGTAARAALADGGATTRAPARVGAGGTARATIRRART
jgi:hypothetical protein